MIARDYRHHRFSPLPTRYDSPEPVTGSHFFRFQRASEKRENNACWWQVVGARSGRLCKVTDTRRSSIPSHRPRDRKCREVSGSRGLPRLQVFYSFFVAGRSLRLSRQTGATIVLSHTKAGMNLIWQARLFLGLSSVFSFQARRPRISFIAPWYTWDDRGGENRDYLRFAKGCGSRKESNRSTFFFSSRVQRSHALCWPTTTCTTHASGRQWTEGVQETEEKKSFGAWHQHAQKPHAHQPQPG